VRAIAGVVPIDDAGAHAMVICPAGFSADAISFAEKRNVQLVDSDRLAELLAGAAGHGKQS
jgi:hypothetical protein